MGFLEAYRRFPLIYKIGIGFVLGIVFGLIVGPEISVIKPAGDIFLRALKMVTMPLVFFTLIVGVASLEPSKMGRIFGKTIGWYLFTTILAAAIGLLLATAIRPGIGLSLEGITYEPPAKVSFIDTIVEWIPINPFAALADFQLIPTIVFALLFGISLSIIRGREVRESVSGGKRAYVKEDIRIKSAGDVVYGFFEGASEVMYKMVGFVLELSPYGSFALTAVVVGQTGIDILLPYAKLLITEVAAISIVIFALYSILLKSYGISPLKFFKGAKEAMLTAFITRSSSGTLPVTMMCADRNFGIGRDLYSFTLPLGATINMNGTVIGHMAIAVFASNIVGIQLSVAQMLVLIIAATMAAVGTAGVPMGGLVTLTVSLGAVGLPFETIGLVMGIYVIIDMFHTVANVTGDMVCTTIISKQEKMTDWEKGVWKDGKIPALSLSGKQHGSAQAGGESQ